MNRIEDDFNWRAPDYTPIWQARAERLVLLRKDEGLLREVKLFYRENIAQFINDWGVTVDPRVASRGQSPLMPFLLFPKQVENIEWFIERWKTETPGVEEKSRDIGVSWMAMATACSLAMFYNDLTIGFGSNKAENVDKIGNPKSLFFKGRMFMTYIPPEFSGGFDIRKDCPEMQIRIPETGSILIGEGGDNIGRGGRTAIYFVDESAHLERPAVIDASLSANTDVRIDMSSVKGSANSFATRRFSGNISVFTFHYRDDPRKDDAWKAKKMLEICDPVVWAQEFEMDYQGSVEGVVIPSIWVSAAVDAHLKLNIKPTGIELSTLDVADRGMDKNAQVFRKGILLAYAESWSGKDSDIYATSERAFKRCDDFKYRQLDYDGDGLGAGVRGDARKINEGRVTVGSKSIMVRQFRGSAAVMDPLKIVPGTDRKAEDFFANFKAQSWWALRYRFQETYKAINGQPHDPDAMISIAGNFPERARLCVELSQPVYKQNLAGKMLIDKVPEGATSPNLADAVMMAFAPRRAALQINDAMLEKA